MLSLKDRKILCLKIQTFKQSNLHLATFIRRYFQTFKVNINEKNNTPHVMLCRNCKTV